MRKFFEMNDMDVLIVAILYFGSVLVGGIYCLKEWKDDDNNGV